MLAIALCLIAFIAVHLAFRHSAARAVAVVFGVGYVYGILRANVLQPMSHFIFDAAVLALYLNLLRRPLTRAARGRIAPFRGWMLLLIGWPIVLALLPVQDAMVQLVGLRGNVFLVPFVFVGALMTSDEVLDLLDHVAWINIAAFAMALVEYQVGIEPFFPRSAVTEIMYASRDVQTEEGLQFRIPSTFTSAHAFAGTMSLGAALFIGALNARVRRRALTRVLLIVALAGSVLSVFMAGARYPVIVLGAIFVSAIIFARVRPAYLIGGVAFVLAVAMVIGREERLQRFRTLQDTELVSARVQTSVNANFMELAVRYPMGNGLGAGGTSMPYFLAGRIQDPVSMENEYGRIMLEQGIPGLLIWLAFLVVTLGRAFSTSASDPFRLGRQLIWVYCAFSFATAFIGVGLLASIPGSAMLLFGLGFVAAGRPQRGVQRAVARPLDDHSTPAPAGAGA